ncbi:MAG: hypothetical protein ACK5Q5_07030 [Planctomycetaceae bacterium]
MAERKNTHGLNLSSISGVTVVDIGDMEIWDGADLSLVRDTLAVLIDRRRRRTVGVQMRHVKYVPSGFFGMLYDWFESGINVYLVEPQDRVGNMLWFQRFFTEERPGLWRLQDLHETGIDGDARDDEEQEEVAPAWHSASDNPHGLLFSLASH